MQGLHDVTRNNFAVFSMATTKCTVNTVKAQKRQKQMIESKITTQAILFRTAVRAKLRKSLSFLLLAQGRLPVWWLCPQPFQM